MGSNDIIDALFGNRTSSAAIDAIRNRKNNGFWYGPSGPKNTRVSGVLITNLHPSSINCATVTVLQNPWAAYPIEIPWHFSQARIVEGSLKIENGKHFGQILNLPSDWPGPLIEHQ